MHSSFIEHNWSPSQIHDLEQLLKCQNLELIGKQGGGNSVVYCVQGNNTKWAIKSYPPYAPNQRDRLEAERSIYQFLNQHQIPYVPSLHAYSDANRWLILDWISGEIPQTYAMDDVNQAIYFIKVVAKLNLVPEAHHLPKAAEACISLDSLLNQIERRFQRLAGYSDKNPELRDFLFNTYYPMFQAFKQKAIEGYKKHHISPDQELALEHQSLIPADFGFHNTIRTETGTLCFFDFDYFGWDDPIKLLADILWHPKMSLTDDLKKRFVSGLAAVYGKDDLFLARFHYTWPLFGLRWTLILLNEFIPDFWQNRQHANVYPNHDEAKRLQLHRAKELVLNCNKGCPYEFTAATSV